MDPISLEDLALLEVLQRVDLHVVLTDGDSAMRLRMIEAALIVDGEDGLELTTAGIELCKSLQHRVAADAQAAKIVQQREEAEASAEREPLRTVSSGS
jgi:hypothetical protein